MKIKIGTRGSKLALWQAYYIQDKLKNGGVESEILTIETKGDKILDRTLSKIGSKGVFTEEIEANLLEGTIDIAVHSAKDMPSEFDDRLKLIAYTEREEANDVLVSNKAVSIGDDLIVGTSSTRRIALLKHLYPHIKIVDMRGNLQTRFKKMEDGACDAMMLAYAGVHRMGYHDKIVHQFDKQEFVPPVGQGAVTIQVAKALSQEKIDKVRELCNNTNTEKCLVAERAFLKKMNGGCSIPVFGHAVIENDQLKFKGGIVSLDGQKILIEEAAASFEEGEKLGTSVAEVVLGKGGKEILESIKRNL